MYSSPRLINRTLLVAILLTLPSCGQSPPAPPLPPARSVYKMTIDNVERSYILRFPPKYDGTTRLPMVMLLHGANDSADYADRAYHFDEKSTAENFILVLPDALGEFHAWNAFGNAADTKDDIAFLTTLVETVEKNYAVDTSRVYLAGHSAGAMMTYRMLLERPDFFAAAGIVAGAVSSDDAYPHPKSPMPLIIFHGVKDETVPYEDSGDAIRFWSAINGCPATPTERGKDGNVTRELYASKLPTHPDIVRYSLANGNHMWAGGNIMPGKDIEPVQDISATNLMWDFFKAHAKSAANG